MESEHSRLFPHGRDTKDEEDDMREPHYTNGDACMRVLREEERNTHECCDGQHDPRFLYEGHAAPPVPHEEHGLTIDPCCA